MYCAECGRLIGAPQVPEPDPMLCEYCLIVASFNIK